MATAENADKILRALKRAGINFVASLPDASLTYLVEGFDKDNDIIHVPLSREEEGVGACMGANLAGKRCALMMQNAGFLNSCNALTTTARQIEIPMLLLVLYAGTHNDMAFPMLGIVTEPVLEALEIPRYVLNNIDDAPNLIAGALVQAYNAQRPVAILLPKSVL
ncbi:MAG TPA: thiamine pyrophosphate-binding protein [Terriglobales bacterium]|nr:thiamine pyrophosphate-binding protein [Terriglobales bacterium]